MFICLLLTNNLCSLRLTEKTPPTCCSILASTEYKLKINSADPSFHCHSDDSQLLSASKAGYTTIHLQGPSSQKKPLRQNQIHTYVTLYTLTDNYYGY